MTQITKENEYKRLKRLLADKINLDTSEIRATQSLSADPFRLTKQGLRALVVDINNQYQDVGVELIPDNMNNIKTVRALAELIWKSIPEQHKLEGD